MCIRDRVSLASGSAYGGALEACLELLSSQPDLVDESGVLDRLGSLLVEAQSLAVMRQRATLRSVSGLEPGSEASAAKLVGAEHDQRVADFALELCGPAGAFSDGDEAAQSLSLIHI